MQRIVVHNTTRQRCLLIRNGKQAVVLPPKQLTYTWYCNAVSLSIYNTSYYIEPPTTNVTTYIEVGARKCRVAYVASE